MDEEWEFEVQDEPVPRPEPDPEPEPEPEPELETRPAPAPQQQWATPRAEAEDAEGPPPVLDDRLRRRLVRLVPGFALTFLVVGWVFVGGAFWVFALVGAALGVFAAWRRRGEVLLGTVSAVAGTVTALLVGGVIAGVSGVLTIVFCGAIGYLVGIDDRLRGS